MKKDLELPRGRIVYQPESYRFLKLFMDLNRLCRKTRPEEI